MDSKKTETGSSVSAGREDTHASDADSPEFSDESGDVMAEDMEYWNEQYAKFAAGIEEEYDANCERYDAEAQLREELTAKAKPKLEAALDEACERDPDVAKLRGLDLDYHEGVTTISISQKELIANPEFVVNTEHMALVVILRHEWMHQKLDHEARGKAFLDELSETENRKVWDWAFNAGADLEINSGLKTDIEQAGLQDEAYVPGHGDYRDWPPGLKAEEYARRIMATPDLRANVEQIAKTTVRLKY